MILTAALIICCSVSAVFIKGSAAQPGNCPDGFVSFQESCYALVDDTVSWTAARTICQVLNAEMMEVQTPEENSFLTNMILNHNRTIESVWMGLEDFVREGHWVYASSQEAPEYTNWAPGEPNNDGNYANGQDCGRLRSDGLWDDDYCDNSQSSHEYAIICEIRSSGGRPVG